MGQKNRERRAAKKRRDQSRQRGRTARPGRPGPRFGGAEAAPTTADLAIAAIRAFEFKDAGYLALTTALADRDDAYVALERMLATVVAALWGRGWAPADVVRVVEHNCSDAHARVAASVAVADGRRRAGRGERLHPRWVDQLDALSDRAGNEAAPGDPGWPGTARDVARAVEVLALLARVPDIPPTVPAPGATGPGPVHRANEPLPAGLDGRVLARVRALLAKAESTEFVEEAEALSAKAQELIARYAIEDALLRPAANDTPPSARRIPVHDPYAHPKAWLLSEVAEANRCRATWSSGLGWSTVFGYEGDLDAVELLFTSLLAQASAALARTGSRRDHVGRSRTTSFRRSFLLGFAHRIGRRLRETTGSQVAAADSRSGGALVPVLAAREEQVCRAQEVAFPRLVSKAATVGNAAGWAAGQLAGQLALLDPSSGALPDARTG